MKLLGRFCVLVIAAMTPSITMAEPPPVYRNPVDCVANSAGSKAFVALAGPRTIAVVDLPLETMTAQWPLPLPPSGLTLSPSGNLLAVTMGETQGLVALLDPTDGSLLREFDAGFSPVSPVFLSNGTRLAICNRFTNSVRLYNTANGSLICSIPVTREPICAVATADEKRLFVGGFLPAQPATANHVASTVDVINLITRQRIKSILLPNGSSAIGDLALSRDGKYIFVTHVLGHYQVPTNQLERGWMNANALSIIEVATASLLGTVLLDDTTLGAANPWGIAETADGKYLAVAHAGTHEISRIPLKPLMQIVLHPEPPQPSKNPVSTAASYDQTEGLLRDLTVMTDAGRIRLALPGSGPRTLAATGSKILVCEYFTGRLTLIDLAEPNPGRIVPHPINLGPEPPMTEIRRGELRFADARLCFEGWQSCISCHPGARSDGLNWDLMNDGLGNPKQTKSMLYSHATPPVMARGIRPDAETAVRAGIRFIQFARVDEPQARSIDAYLRSLRPMPSPHLLDGKLSPEAEKGKIIYQREGCTHCHNGPYYTDLQSYTMPYSSGAESGKLFDTPALVEIWRTAPYLYDGRAATMKDAMCIKINHASDLPPDELDALVEYILSL